MFSYDEYVEVKFNLISSVFDVHVFLSFHMDWDNTKRERVWRLKNLCIHHILLQWSTSEYGFN